MGRLDQTLLSFLFVALSWPNSYGIAQTYGFSKPNPSLPLCDTLREEMDSLRTPFFLSFDEKAMFQQQTSFVFRSMARKIFKAYIDLDIKPLAFLKCLQNEGLHHQAVTLETHYLPSTFFNRTLDLLKSSENEKVRQFAKDADIALNSGAITFLDINVPSDASSGSESEKLQFGGFHRGQSGLYMNPNEMPSSQWFLIFFHEFAHALDPQLREAVLKESKSPLVPTLQKALESANWSVAEEQQIKTMIRTAMDRGFVGEYRAWMASLSLYYKQGRHPRVPWAEQMAGNREVFDLSAQRALFDFLDPRFNNGAVGVFAEPRIKKIVEDIREEWRRTPPEMGGLNKYL